MKNNLTAVTTFLNESGLPYSVFHNEPLGIGEVAIPCCNTMVGVVEEGNANFEAGVAIYPLNEEGPEVKVPNDRPLADILPEIISSRLPEGVTIQ